METLTILDLYNQFDKLVGEDGYDKTHSYQLMTQAKNLIEEELKLKILESLDVSKTASVGDTYLTMKALPTDYRQTIKISVGTAPYYPIPFRRREQMANMPRRFYIDQKNKQFALTGKVGSSAVINHFYLCTTAEITQADESTLSSAVISWPSRFHPMIPYKMAQIYQANLDADFMAFRMSPGQAEQYQSFYDALMGWDQDLKLQDMNFQGGYADSVADGDYPFDVGSM